MDRDRSDLAIDAQGDVWVAMGVPGVARLDRAAAEIARFGFAQGLPGGVTIDHVAVASSVRAPRSRERPFYAIVNNGSLEA